MTRGAVLASVFYALLGLAGGAIAGAAVAGLVHPGPAGVLGLRLVGAIVGAGLTFVVTLLASTAPGEGGGA